MEFSILELLDALPEADVDIPLNTNASARRIKELTMKKIHSEHKKTYHSFSKLTKVLLAAAVLASLAIPVMAATQFQFTDWLAGLFQPGESYDTDLALGSASKSWEMSGWVVELAAEDVTDQGMTVTYEHHTNEQNPQSGTLETDEGYWIEVWNGSGYEKLSEPEKAVPAGKTIAIQADATARWNVNWADTYGSLEAGSYRLGKNFVYTAEDGTQETVTNYIKFRVFSQEMVPVIQECRSMVETLRMKNSYHVVDIGYTDQADQDHYIIDTWKHGNDYFVERRYVKKDGSLRQHDGYLLRDGKGYALTWEGDAVSGESIDWLDETQAEIWSYSLEIYDSNVGEVLVDGNTTRLVSGVATADGREWFTELCFTRNEAGELVSAQVASIPGMEYSAENVKVDYTVEVRDDSESEIAKIIADLKVN